MGILAGLFMILSVVVVNAQDQDTGNYVFVISKVNYLKAIEDAVQQSQAEGIQVKDARVILCGESVKALTEENPILANAFRNDTISVFACGLSLEQMKIDPGRIPKNVKIVRNGILEGMKLENTGYKKFDL